MSLEVKIHEVQTSILRELLFNPSADFAKLRKPTRLTSDHFNFHITRLVELGLVEKITRGNYRLTASGKEYANRLDTDNNTIERQPKVSVIVGLKRINKGQQEYLFQQRLKNPYFGFWGLFSGKVSWGEKITETARRETFEETGLQADFTVSGVYHELATSQETKKIIDDKIFFVVRGENASGKLITDFEGGHNEWLTISEALAKEKKYETLEYEVKLLSACNWFNEQAITYNQSEF